MIVNRARFRITDSKILLVLLLSITLLGCRAEDAVTVDQSEVLLTTTVSRATTIETPERPGATRLCAGNVEELDVRRIMGLAHTVRLEYSAPGAIEIAGHALRLPDPSLEDFGRDGFVSATVDLRSGMVEITNSPLIEPEPGFCADCVHQVLETHPAGESSLVLVYEPPHLTGLWLSHNGVHPIDRLLVDYVPFDIDWTWSPDGTVLWLEHSAREFGRELVIVYFGDTLVEVRPISGYLDPTNYRLTFSPERFTVISYPLALAPANANTELYQVNLLQYPSTIEQSASRRGLVRVIWDANRDDFLYVITETDRVSLENSHGEKLAEVPLEFLRKTNANIDTLEEWRELFTASNEFAFSPGGDSFAIADGNGSVFVFECEALATHTE